MNGFRVVGVYRLGIDEPVTHQHLIALGVVKSGARTLTPTHVWTVDDVEKDGRWIAFAFGESSTIHVTVQECRQCGVMHLEFEPKALAKWLPECLIDTALSRLGKYIQSPPPAYVS